MKKLLYLVKDNNDLLSHCKCKEAPIGLPGQLDCPWCGCAWLFFCINCGKGFTFARAKYLDTSLENLARRHIKRIFKKPPSTKDVKSWIKSMKSLLTDIKLDKQYVYLDGEIFPTDARDIKFTGIYGQHKFSLLPQVLAMKDPGILASTLKSISYWKEKDKMKPTEKEIEEWGKERKEIIEKSPRDILKKQRDVIKKVIHNIGLNIKAIKKDSPDYSYFKESLENSKKELSWIEEVLKQKK